MESEAPEQKTGAPIQKRGLSADRVNALVQVTYGTWSQRSADEAYTGEKVGAFDLPPIPLARFPKTVEGLPHNWEQQTNPAVKASPSGAPESHGREMSGHGFLSF